MSENIITAIGNAYSGLYVTWCLQSFECSCCMRAKYKGRSVSYSFDTDSSRVRRNKSGEVWSSNLGDLDVKLYPPKAHFS